MSWISFFETSYERLFGRKDGVFWCVGEVPISAEVIAEDSPVVGNEFSFVERDLSESLPGSAASGSEW